MLKWGGRAHDVTGVAGTAAGELAVLCPSCPRPGVNLPEGWEDAPVGSRFVLSILILFLLLTNTRFLYMMFLAVDANFRLKNQLVSNYSQDPGLGTGWAYLVPREPYERYVFSRANDADVRMFLHHDTSTATNIISQISTCVGLQALAKASTKFSRGLRHTGVGGVFCGRSEMFLPLGVGNLQKGERCVR
jgi:hypothetical protein